MRIRTLSVLLAAALILPSAALAYRVVHVGRTWNRKSVILHPSDRLVVTLAGNATTGYSWSVMHVDPKVVKFVSRTYVSRSKPPTVGAGGKFILRFRAVAIGTTTLKLGYLQEGNSNAVPAKTYTLHLTVRSPAPRV